MEKYEVCMHKQTVLEQSIVNAGGGNIFTNYYLHDGHASIITTKGKCFADTTTSKFLAGKIKFYKKVGWIV